MRKQMIAALLLACGTASAQKLTYIPYTDNGFMMGTAISDNGQYIGGEDTGGQAFIYDTATGKLKYFASPLINDENAGDEVHASIYSITNDGVAVGYLESGATRFDFASGEYTKLRDDNSTITYTNRDGSFMCGYCFNDSYLTTPHWWKDGEIKQLPQPNASQLDFEFSAASVVSASADGQVIVGYLVDNMDTHPLVVWQRNQGDSTYSVHPICKNLLDASWELDGRQPYAMFSGEAISSNGKWIAVNMAEKDPDWTLDAGIVMARYDVEADTFQVLNCPNASSSFQYFANSITDDGTIIGYSEDGRSNSRTGVICLAGETEVKTMAETFPGLTGIAAMDANGLNTPCAITPDGRFITGFGYVDLSETALCFATYVIDTQAGTTAINSTPTEGENEKFSGKWTIDGKRLHNIKGNTVVINKTTQGKVTKVLGKTIR